MLPKIVCLSLAAALAAAGFVGGSLAATGGGRACTPASPCATGTGTSSVPATTGPTGSTSPLKAPKPTLRLSAASLDFGTELTITGKVPGAPAGQVVAILSQSCGFDQPLPTGKTKTRADGSYSFVVQPMQNAVFYAQSAKVTSVPQPVSVRPRIQLRRGAGSSFHVDVSAGGGSFFSTIVTLERYNKARRLWRLVAHGKLRPNSDPAAIIAVSSATVRANVPTGTKLRASTNQAAVGQCYLPAKSPAITT